NSISTAPLNQPVAAQVRPPTGRPTLIPAMVRATDLVLGSCSAGCAVAGGAPARSMHPPSSPLTVRGGERIKEHRQQRAGFSRLHPEAEPGRAPAGAQPGDDRTERTHATSSESGT